MFRLAGRQLAVFLLCIPAFPAFGQNAIPPHRTPKTVMPIQAYAAEFKTTNVQTLTNGTTVTTETREVRARDSQGRSLYTMTRTPPAAGTEFTSGNIDNPVDNTRIMWNSHNKKASIIRVPALDQRHGCWTSDSRHLSMNYGDPPPPSTIVTGGDGGRSTAVAVAGSGSIMVSGQITESSNNEQTREDLGTTVIQGLEATGTRFTSVIPAGKVGNDNPITTIREIWRAPGFPLPLREISEDPRTGKRTRETVSLTIGEPDISLFQPPEGYEVVTEEMHEVPCQQ